MLTLGVVALSGKGPALLAVLSRPRQVLGLAASALCITLNWGLFIWGVANRHALDVSLAYFICPLCSVILGRLFFGERLNLRQGGAVLLALAGVVALAVGFGQMPWIALVLAWAFAFYGLLRKMIPVEALLGLTVETLLLVPSAALYLCLRPEGGALLTGSAATIALLVAGGPVTAVPLVLFAYGARRLRLATLGLFQYINPSLQMVIAVAALGESFTPTHGIAFACIWSGLAFYSWPFARSRR